MEDFENYYVNGKGWSKFLNNGRDFVVKVSVNKYKFFNLFPDRKTLKVDEWRGLGINLDESWTNSEINCSTLTFKKDLLLICEAVKRQNLDELPFCDQLELLSLRHSIEECDNDEMHDRCRKNRRSWNPDSGSSKHASSMPIPIEGQQTTEEEDNSNSYSNSTSSSNFSLVTDAIISKTPEITNEVIESSGPRKGPTYKHDEAYARRLQETPEITHEVIESSVPKKGPTYKADEAYARRLQEEEYAKARGVVYRPDVSPPPRVQRPVGAVRPLTADDLFGEEDTDGETERSYDRSVSIDSGSLDETDELEMKLRALEGHSDRTSTSDDISSPPCKMSRTYIVGESDTTEDDSPFEPETTRNAVIIPPPPSSPLEGRLPEDQANEQSGSGAPAFVQCEIEDYAAFLAGIGASSEQGSTSHN